MRALVQRVSEASVAVDGRVVGACGAGLLILLGVAPTDTEAVARHLAEKCARLRVFHDADGKMNRSLLDRAAEAPRRAMPDALVVSQFTLYADTRRGNRPGFSDAAPGGVAEPLYRAFVAAFEATGLVAARGVFGAHMDVALVNDGPVTLLLEYPMPA